jgi:hypothetical protein
MEKISNTLDKKDKNKEKTVLQHMEIIIEGLENKSFTDDFFSEYHLPLQSIANIYDLSLSQALYFTICINLSLSNRINIRDIEKFLQWNTIKILKSINDIQALIDKHLLRYAYSDSIYDYDVPKDVLLAVQQNTVFTPKSMDNLSIFEYFDRLQEIFNDVENKIISEMQLEIEIDTLEISNQKLPFNQKIKKESYVKFENKLLFLYFCHRLINEDDNQIGMFDFDKLFCPITYKKIKKTLQKNVNPLIIYNLIENTTDDLWKDRNYYCLTKYAKNHFLKEFNLEEEVTSLDKNLVSHQNIPAKELFYNKNEEKQIKNIHRLLSPDTFPQVQERLSERGMRKGLTLLFYGEAGTGKTETALQMAKQSGRDIMQVDISQTKSCWFGESEKLIREIFERYRKILSTETTTPILLFNEADAVIAKRKNISASSVAQTENTMQNILLQELEHFEGILIATTNLIINIDDAFERRFLYKIKFDMPCTRAKISIWKNILQSPIANNHLLRLTDNDILELATRYDFSGGQIENIVRKIIIDTSIENKSLTADDIEQYCKQERWNKNNNKKIGFK